MTALPDGFSAGAVRCGLYRNKDRLDLGLLLASEPVPAAAVFTRNKLIGAHVRLCREHLQVGGGRVRAVLVNSKFANCATGEQGLRDARRLAGAVAEQLACDPTHVLVMSTGVIGAPLPTAQIESALPALVEATSPDGLDSFAQAIMTTDTVPKTVTTTVGAGANTCRITGCAKGSGMIHPNMATLFGFLLTDSLIDSTPTLLRAVVDRTFNRVSVDGDMSPNDTVLLLGGNRTQAPPRADLEQALADVSRTLCRRIARDGEGATRLITIHVTGALNTEEAARAGRAIATSALVKTAVFGRDPNWGRILSAAAASSVNIDIDRARVAIGNADVYSHGSPHADAEPDARAHMADSDEVEIAVDLGCGTGSAESWTCDFSDEYVRINADYRT